MLETIVVEAVSDKFKNKFSSGSVLANGKWMQVDPDLDISVFKKDTQMKVEVKTNEKGYKSIVDIVEDEPVKTQTIATGKTQVVNTYETDKNRRILVQGIVQAVTASPSLAGLPFTNANEVVNNIKDVATQLIAFVDEQTK